MQRPISEPDLVTILDEADAAAARLRRRLRLPRTDLDDLRQDLLLDLIRRLPAFDATRGTIGAFAGIVLRNQASRIAARVARERRATGGRLLSLDAPAGDGTTLGDRLGDPFNCLGPYSDAEPADCAELRFMAPVDEEMLRAYKTPSLRGVASRSPYMHAGQIDSLAQVIAHYSTAPYATAGHSELQPLALDDTQRQNLEAFLASLDPLAGC